jgi:hypothetical protein
VNYPGVSCFCATYGRPPDYLYLIEEAVESFLRQDYPGPKELIVLNDAPGQNLELEGVEGCPPYMTDFYSGPPVRLFNSIRRMPSVGVKFNWMVENAKYDLLLHWDDDDISLPGRISQCVERLGDAPYWTPRTMWHLDHDELKTIYPQGSTCIQAGIIRREAVRAVGGYPNYESSAYDQAIYHTLGREYGPCPPGLSADPKEWQYVYCWAGRSPTHISGYGKRANEAYHREVAERGKAQGTFPVRPRWHRDYVKMVEEGLRCL